MKARHIALIAVLLATPAAATTVGQNVPFPELDAARIAAAAPAGQQAAWTDYMARSQAQKAADQAALAAELAPGMTPPAPPAESHDGPATMPLDRPPAWYGSAEAKHVADVIVSFQTPAGGWGKNQARDGAVRQKGQAWVAGNPSRYPGADDFDPAADWAYVGTIDNDATITEIRFLARVAAALPGRDGDGYRTAALKGVDYVLAAQYPDGGWPQVWPLQGGYHDAITYNDDAMTHVASLLDEAADGAGDFAFIDTGRRDRARAAVEAAVACILDSQVRIGGELTAWGQQHDPLTLAPVSARNFEMPSLSSAESARLLIFLMRRPDPSPREAAAIRAGVAWLQTHALHDVAWQKVDGDKTLVPSPGAPLLWARYYSLDDQTPRFGDRDKSVHDDVRDISFERRNGYAWYGTVPQSALDAYAQWSQAHSN